MSEQRLRCLFGDVVPAGERLALNPAGDTAPLEFSRLHRLAVSVNIALFSVGALTLGVHTAVRPR